MASSSERADEVANEILEGPVLLWTRDATTINTFETLHDRRLLKQLMQCVHQGKDAKVTKEKLSVLLGTGKDRKSVVIRARVLTRLIAIALGLQPADIMTDPETKKESWRPAVDFETIHWRLAEALQDDNTVLSYLFKDALEEDDEVMTVIFCDRRFFEKYDVPYFNGCDLKVVEEISKLWLSQEFLREFYYCKVLKPLVDQVEAKQPKVSGTPLKNAEEKFHKTMISEENLLNATKLLCELLQKRTVKAGARLLEVMFSFLNEKTDRFLGYELVKGLVIPLVGCKNGTFRNCFLGGIENWARGSDQLRGCHGQSISIGPSSAQTDSNLLCWAARRGYLNLIWCIAVGYTIAPPMSPNKAFHIYATEAQKVSCLWKVALWCATRHGRGLVVMELARPSWVKSIDFNDYTGIEGCLPPLHLVSLLGDRRLLRILCMGEVGIESGAHKADYLGKTPLDYAMQFQLTTRNSKEFKERLQHFMPRYSATMQFPLIYELGVPIPTPEPQSCTQELLQMPGAADRLKELNDMHTTQATFVLVGAALIASVAFIGWLQPPLGYTDYFQFTQPSPPAPSGTYEQYVAMEGHLSVQLFVAFNALSFFLGIGTMLIGAEATLFVHDSDERTLALMKVRKSIKWMLHFFITSMVFIMAAFICAGLAILPPIQRLEWSMIVSLCLGACICLMPLSWILLFLAGDQIAKLKVQIKLIMPCNKDKDKKRDDPCKFSNDIVKILGGPLVNKEDMERIKTLQDEMERKLQEGKLQDEEERKLQDDEERKLKDEKKRKNCEQSRMEFPISIMRMPSFSYGRHDFGSSSSCIKNALAKMSMLSNILKEDSSSSYNKNALARMSMLSNILKEDESSEEWKTTISQLLATRHCQRGMVDMVCAI